jgi:hypothetical protein
MASFTFIGDELETVAFGLRFPRGEAVEVTDAHAVKKLTNNQYFAQVFQGVEVLEAEPPKKRGRPRKAE